jgi:hypothetical protein
VRTLHHPPEFPLTPRRFCAFWQHEERIFSQLPCECVELGWAAIGLYDITFFLVLLESAEIFLALRRSECKWYRAKADACDDVFGASSALTLVEGP